ncbi:MAG TPA: HAD-IIIC family phosphatase [Candidatus Sulfotelmatobacter sp.]|nr:HAD-IIIC family phosphatase [Candidatus Sulfotelmatobacter sp.]
MTPEADKLQSSTTPRVPTSVGELLRNRRKLKQELLKQSNLLSIRVAILGGSTTTEVKSILEIFLLQAGIQPTFYESGYNRYSEDVLFENPDLWNFKPDIVFIHTTWQNISQFPELLEDESQVEHRVRQEMIRFESLWQKIHTQLGALIIQNNFDLPRLRPLGNLEASQGYGRLNFLMRLNTEFGRYSREHSRFLLNDIHYLSAQVGLAEWLGNSYWYNFHMALSPVATIALARNLTGIIKSIYGKTKKCLVLDLDNTLWGGVIGDDGLQNILLGRDHPIGEAFLDFQRYVKQLQRRGIILAVCSKNDLENAKEGFSHRDSLLKLDDFSAFKANWDPKPQNIREIAAELNIGLDSLVFVDDNPVERELVSRELPEVAVPEVGADVSAYAEILEREGYFEVHKIVQDDLNRAEFYSSNAQRASAESTFKDYGAFLESLEMRAEIGPFQPVYLERITQLINKTNQFNLTTKRYTSAEVEAIAQNPEYIALYGRLSDRFGDSGLVSVLIGHVLSDTVQLDVWLMSCRVLKREMELSMFDTLVEQCQARGIRKVTGIYIPSKKNALVSGHYASLGFGHIEQNSKGHDLWCYDVPDTYVPRSHHIGRSEGVIVSSAAESTSVHSVL